MSKLGKWGAISWDVINKVHVSLPEDATFKQRKEALKEAYPFGLRTNYPYKAWCKAQRSYLARYDTKTAGPLLGWERP